MKGLTYKEIEKLEDELNFKYYGTGCRTPQNLKQPITDEDKALFNELTFRGWVNSCLIYGVFNKLTANYLQSIDRCTRTTTLNLYKVELDRALEIIEQQKERFKTATVIHNVFTDSEGLTYNSVEWN